MKYLFFDVETTGLPKSRSKNMHDIGNWPRVIQLAFMLYDDEDNSIRCKCNELIKPDKWEIPNKKFWIENGFSTKTNEEKGVNINHLLAEFDKCVQEADLIVAHNVNFDKPIVGSEMVRANLKGANFDTKTYEKSKFFCTMLSTTNFCKLPGRYGNYKWPKLMELHEKLFDEGFEDAHDAFADITALKRCFFELKRLGIIDPFKPQNS